ncbi:TPA: hypothetical protein ACX6QK_002431 [Photobacterium damselae]
MGNDYTLRELGVDEAKGLVHIALVSGLVLVLGLASLSAAPLSFVVGSTLYLAVNVGLFVLDKVTNFESELIQAVIDEFDNK